MAASTERKRNSNPDPVQDVELSRVQRSADGTIQSARGDRRLNFRAILLHNSHLQAGKSTAGGCGVCGQGLAGALPLVAQEQISEPEVVKGDGADEESDATPSSDPWTAGT